MKTFKGFICILSLIIISSNILLPQAKEDAFFYHQEGVKLFNQGKYESAITSFSKVLEISQKQYLREIESISLNNIGLCYKNLNKFEMAAQFYNQSLRIKKIFDNKSEILVVQSHLAIVYEKLKYFDRALESYQEILKISEILKDLKLIRLS